MTLKLVSRVEWRSNLIHIFNSLHHFLLLTFGAPTSSNNFFLSHGQQQPWRTRKCYKDDIRGNLHLNMCRKKPATGRVINIIVINIALKIFEVSLFAGEDSQKPHYYLRKKFADFTCTISPKMCTPGIGLHSHIWKHTPLQTKINIIVIVEINKKKEVKVKAKICNAELQSTQPPLQICASIHAENEKVHLSWAIRRIKAQMRRSV